MIEKPNISDETIIAAIEDEYPLRVRSIEFVPRGWDTAAWGYRVNAESGAYFLKIRKEISNEAGILILGFLREQGLEQVIIPVTTRNGEAWAKAGGFSYIVYPFISAAQVMDVGMSHEHWSEFGSFLSQLHTMKPTPRLAGRLRREDFVPPRLGWVREIHEQVRGTEYDDPFQKELAEFWRSNCETIAMILERTERLAKRMQQTRTEFVLCHADIHTANILLTEDDRMFIVDWDETMLAPKERDLMFVLDGVGSGELESFLAGYGPTEVHAPTLAYYRYDWCVEDMGGFADQIFTSDEVGDKTKGDSIGWFKRLFAEGNSVETALKTAIDV